MEHKSSQKNLVPKISLVVCIRGERSLLQRLLRHTEGCYDDFVVVHDGPEEEEGSPQSYRVAAIDTQPTKTPCSSRVFSASNSPRKIASCPRWAFVPSHHWPEMAVDFSMPDQAKRAAYFWNAKSGPATPLSAHELVLEHGGRFFEGPRCCQQEPHWPFAWAQAKHDWILRLDADEFPSKKLREWLKEFRASSEPAADISGYSCIWPLWDGFRQRTINWPDGRIFLFNRTKVSFFGMVEQVPICLARCERLTLTLYHQPKRKSYGWGNILLRRQAYRWRSAIATSLLHSVTRLPRWNYRSQQWPMMWAKVRSQPLKESFCHLLYITYGECRALWRAERKFGISMIIGSGLHHFLFCIEVFLRRLTLAKQGQCKMGTLHASGAKYSSDANLL